MNRKIKNIIKYISPVLDVTLLPFTYLSALWMKTIRRLTIYMPFSINVFKKIGIFPIRDHYYEPLFNEKHLKKSLWDDRELKAINFNTGKQLELLKKFKYYKEELSKFPRKKERHLGFYYENSSFEDGDADFLYNVVRYYQPQKIIEIGCGNSSLMIEHALNQNRSENTNYSCKHICIEPYHNQWLEELNVEFIKEKVEDVKLEEFESLGENDILFIDSSHIIRPQGDVLTEYLHILPSLRKGVLVHIHDIFTPKDYLSQWVIKEKRFWNEQYLLEAFLSYNDSFEIVGALNYLHNHYYDELAATCQALSKNHAPGSFWIKKCL